MTSPAMKENDATARLTMPATNSDNHDSDCATHNEPAYPNGPCDCSLAKNATAATPTPRTDEAIIELHEEQHVYFEGPDIVDKMRFVCVEAIEPAFARTLERELAAVTANYELLTKDHLEGLAEAVQVETERNQLRRDLATEREALRAERARAEGLEKKAQRHDWLIANLHLLEVRIDATYCEEQQRPAGSFRSMTWWNEGRRFNVKGDSIERLIAAIDKERLVAQPTPTPAKEGA